MTDTAIEAVEPKQKPNRPTSSRRQSLFVLVFLVVVILFVFTFRMGMVRGDSMYPTYVNGQVVLVRRLGWLTPPLKRGDVVVLRKDNDFIIKRIYRLPGEEITDPGIAEMSYAGELSDYYEQPLAKDDTRKRQRLFVPEGYLAILGDNPRVSEDSRVFGPVPIRDVIGVVVASPPPPNTSPINTPETQMAPPERTARERPETP
jgi:signal peptidase I